MGEGLLLLGWLAVNAAAGVVDLALLPFRPAMPRTVYVGHARVDAVRVEPGAGALGLDHYRVQPPGGGEWFRIEPPANAEIDVSARLLFVHKPMGRKPSAFVALNEAASDAEVRGHVEPAAFARVEPLPGGMYDLRATLEAGVTHGRSLGSAGPDVPSNFQVQRQRRVLVEQDGVTCLREEFVILERVDARRLGGVRRRIEHTTLCADPTCPGQGLRLVFRDSGRDTDEVEREARAFLAAARIDPAVPAVCGATR